MTIKPFLLIFFDNFEKDCFAILFFNLSSLWQDFLLLYIQHNENYVSAADFGGFFHMISRIFSIR